MNATEFYLGLVAISNQTQRAIDAANQAGLQEAINNDEDLPPMAALVAAQELIQAVQGIADLLGESVLATTPVDGVTP